MHELRENREHKGACAKKCRKSYTFAPKPHKYSDKIISKNAHMRPPKKMILTLVPIIGDRKIDDADAVLEITSSCNLYKKLLKMFRDHPLFLSRTKLIIRNSKNPCS